MLNEENIRIIFGLKLRQLRQEKELSTEQLAKLTGISVSYLNEIERGKKYPKTEKIIKLSNVLNTDYDELVSLKLDQHLAPIGEMLNSQWLNDIPLSSFGISLEKLVEIMFNAPTKAGAFISTLIQIAKNYDYEAQLHI